LQREIVPTPSTLARTSAFFKKRLVNVFGCAEMAA